MHPSSAATTVTGADAVPTLDEWEFEYDDNETEDLYFTLDLTTHVPDALASNPHVPYGEARNAANGKDPSTPAGNVQNGQHEAAGLDDEDAGGPGRFQIVDLHTDCPLVKLGDGVYNAYWMTDLGTSFHVAKAGEVPSPRRKGTVLDIVGTSRTRLVGKPVRLQPKHAPQPPASLGRTANKAIAVEDDESDGGSNVDEQSRDEEPLSEMTGGVLKIPKDKVKNATAEAQASFLERLSAIKAKKGESPIVHMLSSRVYHPPANVDEIRQQGLADEAERAKDAKDEKLVKTGQRARKRRKKPTYEEMGIDNYNVELASGRKDRRHMSTSLGFEGAGTINLMPILEARDGRTTRKRKRTGESGEDITQAEDAPSMHTTYRAIRPAESTDPFGQETADTERMAPVEGVLQAAPGSPTVTPQTAETLSGQDDEG